MEERICVEEVFIGGETAEELSWCVPSALLAKAMSSLHLDDDEAKAVDVTLEDIEKELGVVDDCCDGEVVDDGGQTLSLSGCAMEYDGMNEELPEPSLECGTLMLMHDEDAAQHKFQEDCSDRDVLGVSEADMPVWEEIEGGEEQEEAGTIDRGDLEMVDVSTMGVGGSNVDTLAPETCAICGDGSLDSTVDCGNDHQFCFACIYQWVFDGEPFTANQPATRKNTCPLCR